ncbi:gluconolactonase [Pseudomonas brenneri]|uniref:SMP-30/gluconolactonase/LRE family protein n=1 Tax=Pseudomonas brenneri TaxID=129817 RepID=A0A5B2V4I3_9PSED|nr:SMP-30/gluconolactonase/LRE family protein [Pseudomonas brenneri]KAA2233520.1 SMP-30/gluconolactonase/LRE family protein [Pseudomonas brenneri]TWR82246.1 SMP-30/gluconolactonase/LRE family protein [Pseudomonas brenneri]GGL25926.1 gluconolactonase [Pseudomonas brenneri]SDU92473.1 Sugar lactone lactonase YvrE [Pseudomonas brenneri]
MNAELIVDARNATGESPVWVAQENALYWVDIPGGRLHRWQLDGSTRSWQADEMLACIARTAEGKWIGAQQSGIFQLAPHADGRLTANKLAGVEHAIDNMRFNDGRCDRQGRFWAGTLHMDMGAETVGALYRLDAQRDGVLAAQLESLLVPNGLAFSPDGKVMYLSDSHPARQQIWAFDYDIDSGMPHNQRSFVDMNNHPGRPDGAAVDAEGCYWICAIDAGQVLRFTPQGKLDRVLALPVKKPTMCAFGGPGLDTLFVTSIRPQGIDLSDQPLAGGVFALNPGVRGLAETPAKVV